MRCIAPMKVVSESNAPEFLTGRDTFAFRTAKRLSVPARAGSRSLYPSNRNTFGVQFVEPEHFWICQKTVITEH